MTKQRSNAHWYDLFKLTITLMLVMTIAVLLWQGRAPQAQAPLAAAAAATATNAPAYSSPATLPPATTAALPTHTLPPPTPIATMTSPAVAAATAAATATAMRTSSPVSPDMAHIFAPLTIAEPQFGQFALAGEQLRGRLTLQGSGEPDGSVLAISDGNAIGLARIDSDGSWTLSDIVSIDPNGSKVTLQMNDPLGKLLTSSPALSLQVPDSLILQAPTCALVLVGNAPALQGTGTPGSTVAILVNGQIFDRVTVGDDGIWDYELDLESGEYALSASALAADGSALASSEILSFDWAKAKPISADPAAPNDFCANNPPRGIDRGDTYVVARCEYMALIAQRTGVSLQALLAANPQVENPDLIYPNQVLNLPPRN